MKLTLDTETSPTLAMRVVVVDDSEVFRNALGVYLGGTLAMAVVAEVASGEQAVVAAAEMAPDLVLMDVRMPGIGGLAATRLIKELSEHPRVVLMTANDAEDVRDAALAAGADGALAKHRIQSDLPRLLRGLFAEGEAGR